MQSAAPIPGGATSPRASKPGGGPILGQPQGMVPAVHPSPSLNLGQAKDGAACRSRAPAPMCDLRLAGGSACEWEKRHFPQDPQPMVQSWSCTEGQ